MTHQELLAELNAILIEERFNKAHNLLAALCKPRGTEGSRDWIMSIPARPDYDPDLVIGASLRDIPRLLAQLKGKAADLERIAQDICSEVYGPYMLTVNAEHKKIAVDGIAAILSRHLGTAPEGAESMAGEESR